MRRKIPFDPNEIDFSGLPHPCGVPFHGGSVDDVRDYAVAEIEEGYVFPSALDRDRFGACETCEARNICRAAKRYPRPEEKATVDDVLRVMEEEEEDGSR